MAQPQANDEQRQQRQQEWLAGSRRVYPDEVDYGSSGKAQADAGPGTRALSDGKTGLRDSDRGY